jgi:phosphoglycerol transferase MdoB-like AlkP superfamily enzyme
MEAITLSLPPTPGRSIVKRPNNENIFSVADVFKSRGYKTSFIYGGYGYFDNMNYFFSHNGFESIVDRRDFNKDEITFANIWGVCDEDLLNKSIKEFDNQYAKKEKFFSFIMTTSNHRPYTYPDNKIDIPSHTGRDGAVKYTDFAIGEFIKKARTKPWFKDTIFVVIADHCASSAGENEIPLNKYKIPMIVYSKGFISPQKVDKLSSQIDAVPTILGLLNWEYKSKFYGNNILSSSYKQRALVGNYQKLGLYRKNTLTIISPLDETKSYRVDSINSSSYKEIENSKKDIEDIITYYQSADFLYKNRKQ